MSQNVNITSPLGHGSKGIYVNEMVNPFGIEAWYWFLPVCICLKSHHITVEEAKKTHSHFFIPTCDLGTFRAIT